MNIRHGAAGMMVLLLLAGSSCAASAKSRHEDFFAAFHRPRQVAAAPRYPLGEKSFYTQFSDAPGEAAALDLPSLVAGMPLTGMAESAAPRTPGASMRAPGDGLSASGAQAAASSTSSQGSGFALPLAALGLMLYVARRRTAL